MTMNLISQTIPDAKCSTHAHFLHGTWFRKMSECFCKHLKTLSETSCGICNGSRRGSLHCVVFKQSPCNSVNIVEAALIFKPTHKIIASHSFENIPYELRGRHVLSEMQNQSVMTDCFSNLEIFDHLRQGLHAMLNLFVCKGSVWVCYVETCNSSQQ